MSWSPAEGQALGDMLDAYASLPATPDLVEKLVGIAVPPLTPDQKRWLADALVRSAEASPSPLL